MKSARTTKFTPNRPQLLALALAMVILAAACNDSTAAGEDPAGANGTDSAGGVVNVSDSNGSGSTPAGSDASGPSSDDDGEPDGESDGTLAANEQEYLASILIGSSSLSAEPTGCNSDKVLGNVVVDLYLLPGGEILGDAVDSGSTVEMVSRCAETKFGGLTDVGESLLTVSGQQSSDGIELTLTAVDEFEFYFSDGSTMGVTSIFGSFLESAEATSAGVSGTAMQFTIESETMAALSDTPVAATFVGSDSPDDGAWWDNEVYIFFYSEKLT